MPPAHQSTAAVATDRVCLALDVGGSSVKGAVVDAGGRCWCADERRLNTSAPAEVVITELAAALDRLYRCSTGELVGVAMAVPGPFDEERGRFLIQGLPKFEKMYGLELVPLLAEELPWLEGMRVAFLNDAAAFALGEVHHGAGVGSSRVLAITLGTGCGSAFVVDGKIVTSGAGVPANGHVYDLPFGTGTVDESLSSRGLARLWRDSRAVNDDPAPDAATLAELARSGDQAALSTYQRFGTNLALALGPTIKAFAPDVVVLGGNLTRAFDLFGGRAVATLRAGGVSARLEPAQDLAGAPLKGVATLLLGAGR